MERDDGKRAGYQGLAEASERVRDAPRTLKGMNACRNPKAGRSIFPELAT